MHHPSPVHDTYLPQHVLSASWIDPSDKNALCEGMRTMDPATRASFYRHCFCQQACGVFDMEKDDPVSYGLLQFYLNERSSDPSGESMLNRAEFEPLLALV